MTEFASTGASRAREPFFSIPAVVVVLVAVLLAVHAGLTYFGARAQDAAYRNWAFLPGRLTIAIWPGKLSDILTHINDSQTALDQALLIRHFDVLGGGAKVWTLVTYALLHGSWAHVGVNCIWLVAFGPPIARRFGATALPPLLRDDRRRRGARALGRLADGFRAADRGFGRQFRADGGGRSLHLPAGRGAGRTARLQRCAHPAPRWTLPPRA